MYVCKSKQKLIFAMDRSKKRKHYSCLVSFLIMVGISLFIVGAVIIAIKITEKEYSGYQVLRGRAVTHYENYRHHARLSKCEFIGPEIRDCKVENQDTVYAEFYWYNIIDKDTVWIKYIGHLEEKITDGIRPSDNIDIYYEYCKSKRTK